MFFWKPRMRSTMNSNACFYCFSLASLKSHSKWQATELQFCVWEVRFLLGVDVAYKNCVVRPSKDLQTTPVWKPFARRGRDQWTSNINFGNVFFAKGNFQAIPSCEMLVALNVNLLAPHMRNADVDPRDFLAHGKSSPRQLDAIRKGELQKRTIH